MKVQTKLNYADLLSLEWILEDKTDEWEWRDQGQSIKSSYEKERATLERIRQMLVEYPDDDPLSRDTSFYL